MTDQELNEIEARMEAADVPRLVAELRRSNLVTDAARRCMKHALGARRTLGYFRSRSAS